MIIEIIYVDLPLLFLGLLEEAGLDFSSPTACIGNAKML
jgi:hypothetical protein